MAVTGDGIPFEEWVAAVNHLRCLAVHLAVGANDLAAERFAGCLVTETNAQHRDRGVCRRGNQLDRESRPRPGYTGRER